MDNPRIIHAPINRRRYAETSPITQYDYGYLLLPEGVELPATYEIDFSNDEHKGTSLPVYGGAEGAEVPEELIRTGKDIYAFYYRIGDGYGKTEFTWRLPNKCRPSRDGQTPAPSQQSSIDQLIVRSNEAVTSAEQSASAAGQSAQNASQDAGRAEQAKTDAETAQRKAEDAQESAERAKDDAETSERNASESERKAKGYAETASEKADSIHSMTASAQTLPAESSATASYDAETGVMSFGIPKGKDGRNGTDGDDGYSPTANVSKSGKVATITVTDKNGTTSAQLRDGEDGATGATPNLTIGTVETLEPTESATASITGTPENPVLNLGIPQGEQGEVSQAEFDEVVGDVNQLKSGLSGITSAIVKSYADIAPYLYKRNVYYNNGVETTLSGYDTYFIPLNVFDICAIHYDKSDTFFGGLRVGYVFSTVDDQNVITNCTQNENKPDYFFSTTTVPGIFNAIGTTNTTGVYVTVKNGLESKLEFYLNERYTILKDYPFKTAINVEESERYISDRIYFTGELLRRFAIGYHATKINVKAGDKFTFSGSATGINQYGILRKETGYENITSYDYTVTANGVAFVYNNDAKDITIYYYPVDAVTVSTGQIIGTINANNQFNGLSGVAFGTSLTYRAQTTHGYLQYLPDLCGMAIENQGIGSSKILGNMLTAIKAYTNYADKDVAILEGFVNDWYNENALGHYDDTEETTVCGCVRSALNYMMSQNANLTIFLVLDPYGKVNGDVDCSSDAIRGGVTQKEYYDEIAKVGESLGIPVIKQYAISQISENTPQYIADNIHPTQLGAKQSAYAIWSQMRQYFPNQK